MLTIISFKKLLVIKFLICKLMIDYETDIYFNTYF